jgi:23S rRNA-/tRNA-specific pseudouridylate synthase
MAAPPSIPPSPEPPAREQPGSPAWRFDPPLRRIGWVTGSTLPLAAFLEEVRRRCGLDAGGLERLLQHAGLQLAGRPWDRERPPDAVGAGTRVVVWVFVREPEAVPLPTDAVVLDARGVVAVAKPAWLPVQGTRASRRLCLEAALRERLGCPGLVAAHRLDRETSGIVLFARDRRSAAHLGVELAARRVEKRYHAVVSPAPCCDAWRATGWIGRAADPRRIRFRLTAAPRPGARPSETAFRVLARQAGAALLEARPLTGRSHQIRLHLAAGGTPIAGDALYGGEVAARRAERLQLHASSLRLRLAPDAEAEDRLVAEPPPDFAPGFARGFWRDDG